MRTQVALSAVSVIVPTKNERTNLPVLMASLPDEVELVVCDASDDGTAELARQLRPQRTRVLSVTGGIAAARQAGALASRGELLVFTDADVSFDAAYFGRLAAWTGQDGLCGAKLSRDGFAAYYRAVAVSQRLACQALGLACASGSNMVITRPAFTALGGFRTDLPCNEDTELFLRAGRMGLRVGFDPDLRVWAHDHRRLQRGVLRKTGHALLRSTALYVLCRRLRLPRLLISDWGYWTTPLTASDASVSAEYAPRTG